MLEPKTEMDHLRLMNEGKGFFSPSFIGISALSVTLTRDCRVSEGRSGSCRNSRSSSHTVVVVVHGHFIW